MAQDSNIEQDADHDLCKGSDFYSRNELPVDRGWAWVICFAGFLMSFNFGLTNQTMAILFLEVIELFDATLTTASLIFLFYTLGAGLTSAISTNFIVPKFGEKRVCCVTGVIFSLTSVGFYLSPRIEVFLCFAAIKGICMGAIFVPSISLIRHYFHRRRSVAQILGRAGASAAGIVMPPLIRATRYEYGIQGTFLIVAAVELHIVMAGLLLRPVQSYRFKPDLPPLPNQNKKNKMKENKDAGQQNCSESQTGVDKCNSPLYRPNNTTQVIYSAATNHKEQNFVIEHRNITDDRMICGDLNAKPIPYSIDKNTETLYNGHPTENDFNLDKRDKLNNNENNFTVLNNVSSKLIREDITEDRASGVHVSLREEAVTLLQPIQHENLNNGNNLRYQDAHALSSTLSLASVGVPEESVIAPDVDNRQKDAADVEKSGRGKYQFLQKWTFRLVLVFGGIGAGNIYIKNYVPTIAVSQGASLDQAAMLLTLIGILDFISRISLGFFADTHLLKPSQIVAVSHLALGVMCQLSRSFSSFPTLVVMSSIIGIFIGTRISMTPLICIEVVGVEMMPQAFSMVTTVGTFSAAAMNPSLGAVADSFESFVPVLHILGVFFFTSASILLLLPVGLKVDKRNKN